MGWFCIVEGSRASSDLLAASAALPSLVLLRVGRIQVHQRLHTFVYQHTSGVRTREPY